MSANHCENDVGVCCSSNREIICKAFNKSLIGNYMLELQRTHLTQLRVKFNVNVFSKLQFIAAEQ